MSEDIEMNGELARIEYTPERVELIKRTICSGSTNDELALFVQQCKRTGLDPFAKQIHAVKRWDSNAGREVMSIQTGIDGFRLIADRTGKYAGNDEPIYDVEDKPHPNKASVTVWKIVEGQRVPFTRSARWAEFVQTKKDGNPTRFWLKMPYLMLGKAAEALALRAAFPQELSGLYTTEEMDQAGSDDNPLKPVEQKPFTQPSDREEVEQQVFDCLSDMASIRGKKFDDAYWAVLRSFKWDYASLADIPYGQLCMMRETVVKKLEVMQQEVNGGK